MNPKIRYIIPLAGLVLASPVLRAAEAPEAKKEIRKEMRVLAVPGAPSAPTERRLHWVDAKPAELENVTFLGVQTAPVGPTLAAQLGLAKDHGLAVAEVVPDSPAAGVLQAHDILLKFNDQILVDVRQLTVLVRSAKAGDEVALTYLRGGKEATAKVKLGQKEMPKRMAYDIAPAAPGFHWQGGSFAAAPAAPLARGEVDRLLGMIELGRDGMRRVVRHNELGGDRLITITVNTGDNTMSYSDEEGSLEVTTKDGKKELVAKDAKGETLFSGPINTPEERQALPPAVAGRLEKIENLRGFSFKTDETFEGGEVKIVRPLGRGIALPAPPARTEALRLREL